MRYDVFTEIGELADRIIDLTDRACLIDTTERPDVYQFFDLDVYDLSKIKQLVADNSRCFEVRNSKTGGFVWPSEGGCSISQALDVL